MQMCGLRAALAFIPEADQWVLHDPRLWLGTAFHEVMKAVRLNASAIDSVSTWDAVIARIIARASEHPFDRRYMPPERWPSYFLVRQRCLSLAAQAPARAAGPRKASESGTRPAAERGPERRFESHNGLLVGRPDFYDGRTIIEHKSNLPDAASAGALMILESYRRQVRLYAAIIADATGRWPANARILAASGQTLEIALDPAECDAEAKAAVDSLKALNAKIIGGARPHEIASPGPKGCMGCPFKLICRPFWSRLNEPEMLELPDAALAGELALLEDGPDGDIYSAILQVEAANRDVSTEQRLVLRKSIHGEISHSAIGHPCRVTGFVTKADRRVRTQISSVISPVTALPVIECAV